MKDVGGIMNTLTSSRRWFRFRLRTLLIIFVIFAAPLAWIAKERRQSEHENLIAEELQAAGFETIGLHGPYTSLELLFQGKPQGWWRELGHQLLGDRILLISGGTVDIRDITVLAELSRIQWLDLHGTQVTDLTPVAGLTSLKVLYLSDTQFSDEQVRSLKNSLPQCNIQRGSKSPAFGPRAKP